jgi:hypothetical protein
MVVLELVHAEMIPPDLFWLEDCTISSTAAPPLSPSSCRTCSKICPLGDILAEKERGDSDGNDQERRQGKHCVISQGCSEGRRFIYVPFGEGLFQQSKESLKFSFIAHDRQLPMY